MTGCRYFRVSGRTLSFRVKADDVDQAKIFGAILVTNETGLPTTVDDISVKSIVKTSEG